MQEASASQSEEGAEPSGAGVRPVLIYDGDCGFCVYWARYWQALTGDAVRYAAYQEVSEQYPDISEEAFRRAVQYVAPGRRASAAEASFLTLSHARGRGYWLALYRRLPGFAALSERAYSFIAAHRSAFHRVSLLLWGRNYSPSRHDVLSFLFLRGLALVYLSAFVSFGIQALGLIGSHGILPVADLVSVLGTRIGPERFLRMPMLFWLNASDAAIQTVCWAGVTFSILLLLDLLPRLSLFVLYALYLSLLYGGQEFMSYQWDVYLLEAGFLALLLSFARTPGIWLLRWLLFRFMLMSGVVKLLSGDPNWRNLSALSYHFFTQPLPTPLAWYAAHLPQGVLKLATGGTFFVELVLPFLIFAPRRLRFVAAFGFLLFQSCIVLTGNYNWFNFQTMLLCLLLFDDAALETILPQRWLGVLRTGARARPPWRAVRLTVGVMAVTIVFSSLVQMAERFGGKPPVAAETIEALIDPLHIVSGYGLFAVMTTQRDEIVIEGSEDGVDWKEYEFRYKPGDPARRPRWNIPLQPRLDWQMWFAALDDPRRLRWFSRFLQKVLENDPAVTTLLANDPFPDKAPLYVRAQFYDYRLTDEAQKAQGLWWTRRLLGFYFPEVRLKGDPGE
jgi:predicted DCC family thiol-disulfide oxidoreductase YuxK